jgi:hypothetical protein
MNYDKSQFASYRFYNDEAVDIDNVKDSTNSGGNNTYNGGGYPVSLLFSNTKSTATSVGGNKSNNDLEHCGRFANLVVPMGLVLEAVKIQPTIPINPESESIITPIDDVLFELLFSTVAHIIPRKTHIARKSHKKSTHIPSSTRKGTRRKKSNN